MSLHEQNIEIVQPATISHQTEVHSELRPRMTSKSKTRNDVIAKSKDVVEGNELHFVNQLPAPLPSGYKPSLPVIDNPADSTSLA